MLIDDKRKTILILASNPKNTPHLRLDEEAKKIKKAIKALGCEKFNIIVELAITQEDLLQAVLEHKPEIIHFSGHGENNGLLVEDKVGNYVRINTTGLANFLATVTGQHPIECIILNACYSRDQAEEISENIKYVIGMTGTVGDEAAITFSVAFYVALCTNVNDYEYAFNIAKTAPEMANIGTDIEPVIYIDGFLKGTETPLIDKRCEPAKLNFKNRKQELDKIKIGYFIVINAASGYGKTYLLEEIERIYEKKNEKSKDKESKDKEWQINFIKLSHPTSFKQEFHRLHTKLTGNKKYSKDALALALATGKRLLIFDNAEVVEDLWFLFDFLEYAKNVFRLTNLRIIVAGRYIISPINKSEWLNSGFNPVELLPLNEDIILDFINEEFPVLNLKVKQELAKKIHFLSCGHPKIISILIGLAKEYHGNLTLKDDDIFKQHIKPCLKNIFKNVIGFKLVDYCLKKLSVFRQFNLSTIQMLHDEGKITLKPPVARDALDLIAKLGLVTQRGDMGYYSDGFVRNLLILEMRLFESSEFKNLNELAITYYSGIMADNPITTGFCTKEIIYHVLQREKFETFSTRKELKELLLPLVSYLNKDSWNEIERSDIENTIRMDDEILKLLKEKSDFNNFTELLNLEENI